MTTLPDSYLFVPKVAIQKTVKLERPSQQRKFSPIANKQENCPDLHIPLVHLPDDLSDAIFELPRVKHFLNFNEVFTTEETLGIGGFGKVIKVISNKTERPFALKILYNQDDTNLLNEIGALIRLSAYPRCSQDFVCYFDVFTLDKMGPFDEMQRVYAILMEYIEGEELSNFVEPDVTLNEEEIIDLAKWLINAVRDLHDLGYVHRDIKPQNIIIQPNGVPKLIDFGLACIPDFNGMEGKYCQGSTSGTPNFVAPEIYNGSFRKDPEKYYRTADVFAIGVTLYLLIEKELPYDFDEAGRIRGQYRPITSDVSQCLKDIVSKMLLVDPDQRMTLDEASDELQEC